jgi:FKBP-type peptidyl-prolyl cis-trans isomerase FklB
MKNVMLFIAACMLIVACKQPAPAGDAPKEAAKTEVTKASLKTQDNKLNYAVGYDIGKNIKRNRLVLDESIFMKGMKDGMAEPEIEPLIPNEEMAKAKRDHSKTQREIRKKEREELGKKNKEEGEKFLAENKKKEGVVTLESGLQYKILKEGTGEKPAETDRVKVNYKGTLIDGTEFDSSYKRNKPATFSVNRVVKGWTEALQLMPVGSKWQVFIPSELGYGARGAGEKIGPNATLIFEVELVEIVKPAAAAPPGETVKKKASLTVTPGGKTAAKPGEAKPKAKAAAKEGEKKE